MGLALGLAAVSCAFPTDKSDEVYVTVVASDTLLARGIIGQGQTDFLFARAWRRLPAGDSAEILNVDFSWTSDDNTIVRVERKPSGAAEVTGVNVGTVAIRAKAAAFDQSIDAAVPVRVSPTFIIDSIRPTTVGYGGKLSVFGVRVNQIFFMDQGFGTLIPDEFSFTGSLEGLGRLDFWVPFPATSAHPFYFGPGVFGSAADSVDIPSYYDVFEPNYALPSLVDINGAGGPRTFFGLPVLFYNPALYYEPYTYPQDGPFAIDWYRFARSDTTQAVTYIVNSQVFDDTAYQYIADTLAFNGSFYGPVVGWLNAPGIGTYYCYGQFFGTVRETRSPTTIIALRTLPGPGVHLFSNYGKDGPYSVVVVNGYFTQDRRIGPDRFEENETWCRWTDETFNASTDSSVNGKHIVVGLFRTWRDSSLTIDNPQDIDWYRFRVQAPFIAADSITTIRVRSLPFTGLDFADIDLYLHRASDFAQLALSAAVGSNEAISLNLPAGDYYLGVVDAAGTPTRYSMCMVHGGAGVNCTPGVLPGAPAPEAVTLAPSVYRIRSHPPRDPGAPLPGTPFAPPPR